MPDSNGFHLAAESSRQRPPFGKQFKAYVSHNAVLYFAIYK
ncbi:hypothetical protein Barb7_02980 [Bacteroidales bacterium Barb7]|nr:hypothetical protein Barb7_02980 [Bacteroidales bacterium Barb7]